MDDVTLESVETPVVGENINDNLGMVTYIMLGRIYDMLSLIADGLGKGEEALRLISVHESGEMMCPPPSINIPDDIDDDEENDDRENDNEHVKN